ncbi:MAG: hypothetical protein Fur0023_16280 [Bacteroidia bacterium]
MEHILSKIKNSVCEKINIIPEGINRYQVFTPFTFDDGDNYVVILKIQNDNIIITDEGHTLMHLSYKLDINSFFKGNKNKILNSILNQFDLLLDDGEIKIISKIDNIGNAFYSFIQGIIKITDISYLSKEKSKSQFYDLFESFLTESFPKIHKNYTLSKDINKKYPVDFCLNNRPKPIFIFPILNDDKCKDVTVNLLKYEQWNIRFESIAVFENQEEINRKTLARFSDVCGKQFSSFDANKDRIKEYISMLI